MPKTFSGPQRFTNPVDRASETYYSIESRGPSDDEGFQVLSRNGTTFRTAKILPSQDKLVDFKENPGLIPSTGLERKRRDGVTLLRSSFIGSALTPSKALFFIYIRRELCNKGNPLSSVTSQSIVRNVKYDTMSM